MARFAVATGAASIAVVYAALFAVGAMGTLADNASSALLPALVPAEDLQRANARLSAVQLAWRRFTPALLDVADPLPLRPPGAS